MNLLSFLPWLNKPAARDACQPPADEAPPADAEDRVLGCGWFDSSHDLHSGLMVREHPSVDTVANEVPLAFWLELQLAGRQGGLA